MDTAMTTFARGLPTLKRAGTTAAPAVQAHGRWEAVGTGTTARLTFAASDVERRAIQRDYAWVEAAATAALRLPRG